MSDSVRVPQVKVVFAGNTKVGKTSIIARLTTNSFFGEIQSTIGAAFERYQVSTSGGDVMLQLWDTAGQEQYRAFTPLYFRSANVAILVFDVTSQESFDEVSFWHQTVKDTVQGNLLIFLVGNKSDLRDERVIDFDLASQFAEVKGILSYTETSAKTGEGITELFTKIGETAIERSFVGADIEITRSDVNKDRPCC
jgi:small GTP-binding protein